MDLGLPHGLDHIVLYPFYKAEALGFIKRKGTDKCLIEKIFIIPVWDTGAIYKLLFSFVDPAPLLDAIFPFFRNFRQNVNSRPHVFASFRVMGGCGIHGVRPGMCPFLVEAMELLHRYTEFIRTSTHFIKRKESVIYVENRILKPFGHQWSGELLKFHDKMKPLLLFFFLKVFLEFKEKKFFNKVQFVQQPGIPLFGLFYRLCYVQLICFTKRLLAYIGSINWKERQNIH